MVERGIFKDGNFVCCNIDQWTVVYIALYHESALFTKFFLKTIL